MSKLFDRLQEQLLHAGVAPRHVTRFVMELTHHFEDVCDELEQAGYDRWQAHIAAMNRLGRMEDLAQSMINQPQFRSWTSKAPWAVLVVGSLLAWGIGTAATAFIAAFGIRLVSTEWTSTIATVLNVFSNFLLPLGCAGTVAIIAIRQRLDYFWPVVGIVALTAVHCLLQIAIQSSENQIAINVGAAINDRNLISLIFNLVFILPPFILISIFTRRYGSISKAYS